MDSPLVLCSPTPSPHSLEFRATALPNSRGDPCQDKCNRNGVPGGAQHGALPVSMATTDWGSLMGSLLLKPSEVSQNFPKSLLEATPCERRCLAVPSLPQYQALKIEDEKTREGLREAHRLREI